MNARVEVMPVWQFLRNDGSVIAPVVRLLPDGRIEGHRHENETSWTVRDNCVHFLTSDGRSVGRVRFAVEEQAVPPATTVKLLK